MFEVYINGVIESEDKSFQTLVSMFKADVVNLNHDNKTRKIYLELWRKSFIGYSITKVDMMYILNISIDGVEVYAKKFENDKITVKSIEYLGHWAGFNEALGWRNDNER